MSRPDTSPRPAARQKEKVMSQSTYRSHTIIENLEKRVLFAQINVADFGAHPNDGRDDHGAIEAAIRASRPGDTVVFQSGQYDLNKHMHFSTERTYRGSGKLDTRLKFNVGERYWGAKVLPDASNVVIENFVFDGGGLGMSEGQLFRNITIRNNEFVNTPRGTFNGNGPAIYSGVRSDGLKIVGNYIHDSDKYGFIIYSADRLTITHNTLKNLSQGGHILDPGKDIVLSFNKLQGMVRMGFEMQRHGSRTAENVTVEGNVLTDWRRPFHDSFGLSIVPDGSHNVRVINNYIQGVPRGWGGQWGPQTSGNEGKRMGYAIEYGSHSGEVSGNVIGGAFCNYVSVSGGGGQHSGTIPVKNNKFYGVPSWTDYIWKQAYTNNGFGYREENNLKDPNLNNMPSAPSINGGNSGSSGNNTGSNTGGSTGGTLGDREGREAEHGAEFVWLAQLKWASVRNGWGAVEIDRSNGELGATDGVQMSINGEKFDRGLGVHASSEIVYRADGKYKAFTSKIGVDDEVGDNGSVVFQVWADGQKIYDSGVMTGRMGSKALNVDLRGVNELKLIVTDAGDNKHNDHANWANAQLIMA
jgi:hypothetical protein